MKRRPKRVKIKKQKLKLRKKAWKIYSKYPRRIALAREPAVISFFPTLLNAQKKGQMIMGVKKIL